MSQPIVLTTLVTLFVILLAMLGTGVWVAVTLAGVGVIGLMLFTDASAGSLIASTLWDASWGWPLTALPLFIWMGEILFNTRLSEYMFKGLGPWVNRLPGRLIHVNVLGCGIMAAVAGSSAVTCVTIGRMSLPELEKRGYDEMLAVGSLAGSGTLGLLIPPSIVMIVYGVLAQQSIARLFIAGVLPGLLLMSLFMGYVGLWSLMHPHRVPAPEPAMSLREKLGSARQLIPVVLLITAVIGSIYGGVATPTEAAALGVLGSLGLAAWSRTLTAGTFMNSLMSATRVSCMIAFIIGAAAILSMAMAFLNIPQTLAQWVDSLGLSPYMLLLVLSVLFIVLGCFLDGISILVLSSAVVLPMVKAAGIDLLWFGIYMVILIEMAQVTPPVGFNLFVLQSLTRLNIWQITRATIPFFLLLCLALVLITVFPQIVFVLPDLMR
ncbi:MAG: TRAP transporter large permease subunit [Castellaniella sp.]